MSFQENGLATMRWVVGLAVTVAIVAVIYRRRHAAFAFKNGFPLPPGPPPKWFWENAMPAVNIARTLADWVTEYGPLITLRQGSDVIIIIGRVDAATEIMEKEGAVLVDRPHSIAAGELLSRGMRILLQSGGEQFRRQRKALHTHLGPKAVECYRRVQFDSARNVIVGVLNDPKHHQEHAKRYAASVVLRVTYGKSTPTSFDDSEFVRIRQALAHFQIVMRPGAHLVDRIPLLKYIPGYGSRIKQWHEFELQLYREQLDRVKRAMLTNEGHGNESLARTLLENGDEHRLSTDEMAYLAGTMFGAGTDTTGIGISTMIMAAACHPEAQARVQEELDMVVGMGRTPTWKDSESLPQLHAFIWEALRWRPIVPIGFLHRASSDVIWRGQCIPAGATVLGCHWAISRDPVVFPDAERFDPQRWFDKDGQLRSQVYSYTYGFGRRICPGQNLANQSLYINIALLLWSFRIAQRPDAPIDTNDFMDAILAHAAPFEVDFVPRMEESRLREMIEQSSG